MEIKVITNITDVVKDLNSFAQKQVPFAIAKALTRTAQDAQEKVLGVLPEEFTIRTSWPKGKYGFKITAASKQTFTSSIHTIAPWIVEFEEGALRTPKGPHFAVPTKYVRRTKKSLIGKTQKPRYLLDKATPKAFFQTMKSGKFGIFQRKGKSRYPIILLYSLIDKAKIISRLHLFLITQGQVNKRFEKNFTDALAEAQRTAK